MTDAPKDDDFVFVEVTKTFMMSKAQARKMVSVSRLIHSDRTFYSRDDDGTEIRTTGEDFLTEDMDHDYAEAAGELADPEGLLGLELVSTSSKNLDANAVDELVRFWPDNWRSDALRRLDDLDD